MKRNTAPDLGITYIPTKKNADEKAKTIVDTLKKNKLDIIYPAKEKLPAFLYSRMKEQGRFAGLIIKKDADVCFLKFPLGGVSATHIAAREAQIYKFVNALNHTLPITRKAEIIKTPYGYGLITNYFTGKRLDNTDNPHSIAGVADLIYSIQTLISSNPSWKRQYNKGIDLFKKYVHPIHTYSGYYTEIDRRVSSYLQGPLPPINKSVAKLIYTKVKSLKPVILEYKNKYIFVHRDFFDKNILISNSKTTNIPEVPTYTTPGVYLYLVDFEHAAVVKNYALGLNFDLANIVVQWYKFPEKGKKLIELVRQKHRDKKTFDASLKACLIIQILAKLDPIAQKMTPGGVKENVRLLKNLLQMK